MVFPSLSWLSYIDHDANTWSSKGKSGQEEKVQHVGYIPPGEHHHHNDDDDDDDGDGKVHQSKLMIRLYSNVYTKIMYYVKHIFQKHFHGTLMFGRLCKMCKIDKYCISYCSQTLYKAGAFDAKHTK